MHRKLLDPKSSRPDGFMRPRRRRSHRFLWDCRPQRLRLYLRPGLYRRSPHRSCVTSCLKIYQVRYEPLAASDLRSIVWDVEGVVRWIRCLTYVCVGLRVP